MKKIFLLVGLFALAFTGCVGGSVGIDNRVKMASYEFADSYTAGSRTYSAGEIGYLDVEWCLGEVNLVESEAETLTVKESGEDLQDEMKMRTFITGNTLKVRFWKSGYSAKVDPLKKALTVEIPKGIGIEVECAAASVMADTLNPLSLDVQNTSGSTKIRTANVTEEADFQTTSGNIEIGTLSAHIADLETTSGNITVESLQTTDKTDAESTSGKIEIGTLKVRTADVESTSGRLILGGVECDRLVAQSTSGDVLLTLVKCTALNVETTSASVELKMNGTGLKLNYKSRSGQMRTQLDYEQRDGGYVFAGGGCTASVETVSGNLSVK